MKGGCANMNIDSINERRCFAVWLFYGAVGREIVGKFVCWRVCLVWRWMCVGC